MTAVAEPPKREITRITSGGDLRDMLTGYQQSIQEVLPRHLTPERMIKLACIAASKTPALLRCTQASIVESVMKAAELGLDCSGTLGEAYLIPYGDKCQFIVGYQGLIKLARNSGELVNLNAVVVYERDSFKVQLGTDSKIIHEPSYEGDRGKIKCVYAVANFRNGGHQFDVMTKADVDKIRARSKAGKSGPWVTDYEEMARKTVVRRLCKYLPKSQELQKAMEADGEFDQNIGPYPEVRVVPSGESSATEDLAKRLTEKNEPPPAPEPPSGDDMPPIDAGETAKPPLATARTLNAAVKKLSPLKPFQKAICQAIAGDDVFDETMSAADLASAASVVDAIGAKLAKSTKPDSAEKWAEFVAGCMG